MFVEINYGSFPENRSSKLSKTHSEIPAHNLVFLSSQEIKKEMKKDPLSSKAPEKPRHDIASGNALLSSETILRSNKRGMEKEKEPPPQHTHTLTLVGDILFLDAF